MAEPEWRTYLWHIPTKEDFKTLITEVKDTCRAKIAIMRHDLKTIADRVESLEEAHDATQHCNSQLQLHASAYTFLRETCCHLEDLGNRGRQNNIRVRGLPGWREMKICK